MQDTKALLERIAIALEAIAAGQQATRTPRANAITACASSAYLGALERNSERLKGRMSMAQISEVISMPVGRGDQASIGAALTAYGARKGKSGSARYYVFD